MSRNRSSVRRLIEQRVDSMSKRGDLAFEDDRRVHHYACLDTGMPFKTIGEQARRSPFTGSTNIVEQTPAEFQALTDVPGSQKDPFAQTPVSMNPVPATPGAGSDQAPAPWYNAPIYDNPSPDMQGQIGADASGIAQRGYVPYPTKPVPPHVNKAPGDETDDAPTGSK